MKTVSIVKKSKDNGYQSDDDGIRYKINTEYFNNYKSPSKLKKFDKVQEDEDSVRYKFPPAITKSKIESKPKQKNKIKVNFWSNKQSSSRLHNVEDKKSSRRHTVGVIEEAAEPKAKPTAVKVRKRVSFLPSPLFLDNHIPMVTVPDDLTIQLNEEEANDLGEDLNEAFVNSDSSGHKNSGQKMKSRNSLTQSPRNAKRKRSFEETDGRRVGDNELEFFSKYIVQKLRKMETNQRIYSENLINTVLMLGQLGKLNGKSKINEA